MDLAAHLVEPDIDTVSSALERLFASGDFDASPRSREFLCYIVEETAAGRAAQLSQTEIARRVFRRRDDFDPNVDPIVRIQAGRLRRSLERYYLLAGRDEPVRIDLPRGSYVPVLRLATAAERPISHALGPAHEEDDWPVVVVHSFEGSARESGAAALLREQLATELGRYQDVHVVLAGRRGDASPPTGRGPHFAVEGTVRKTDDGQWLNVRLTYVAVGRQLWADEYHLADSPDPAPEFDRTVGLAIAARIASEQGIVARTLASEHQQRPLDELGPYGALLRSYRFLLTREAADLAPAIEALRRAVSQDPNFGLAWTQLGGLYAANYAFELASIDTPIEDAVALAQRGVRLEPTSRRARSVLAMVLLVKGELEASRTEAELALASSPASLVYLDVIGWILTLLGCWERGRELVARASDSNPYHLPVVFHARWVDLLRQGRLDEAYGVALHATDTHYFWRSLMRASTLGLMGRTAEAEQEAAELLRQKPDFRRRGQALIGRLIKIPEVSGQILEGMARAGLCLDDACAPGGRGHDGAMNRDRSHR